VTRIVFVGAVKFSRHCLETLIGMGAPIRAVLTPTAESLQYNSDCADLAPVARDAGIPVYRFAKINTPEVRTILTEIAPDVVFAFGFSQLVGADLLAIPRLGWIGTHPTLLPRHRGRHPIPWAIVNGLTETGLTFFRLDEGADSGDIVWQKPIPMDPEEDAGTLYSKVEACASEGLAELLPQLLRGVVPRRPQDETLASYWRKRTEEDGEIHWNGPVETVHRLVRALTRPYLGAHTFYAGQRLVVWRGTVASRTAPDADPGRVLVGGEGRLLVAARDGVLELTDWHLAGDRRPSTGDILG
jgi:methionyl-tRNA formyltransferase